MSQATEAAELTDQPDAIIISKPYQDMVESLYHTQPIGTDKSLDAEYGPYYTVKGLAVDNITSKPSAQVLKSSLERSEPSLLRGFIQPYVFPGLLPYVELAMENWFCNLSEVTILCAQISLDLGSLSTSAGVAKFNEVVTVIQKILIQTKGVTIRLFTDEAATTLVAIWNTHSTSSPESCAQAVCAGKRLIAEMSKLSAPVCIGIASGKVFAGVIGVNSGRREFSVVGEAVYLAYRLMQAAAKSEYLKIIIDEATAHGAQNRTVCKFNEQIRPKPKGELLNTYYPEDTFKRHRLALTRAADGESTADILLALEDSYENLLVHQIFAFKMGSLDLFKDLQAKIIKGIQCKSKMLLLKGSRGLGKSKLVQDAIGTAKENMMDPYLLSFSPEPHQYNEHFEGLINFYQRLLVFARTEIKDFHSKEEQFLRSFLKSNSQYYHHSSYRTSCLDQIPEFVQSISEQSSTEIKITKRKYLHISELRECTCLIMEALINFMADAVKSHLGAHIVLVLDNLQFFGSESINVLSTILPRVEMTLVGILTVKTQYKVTELSTAELQGMFASSHPEILELQPLPLEIMTQLFNSYCTARFSELECILDSGLCEYIYSRTQGNILTALSFLDALFIKDYISNRGTKRVTCTDRFREVLDNSRGEEFVVTPVTLVREKGHLLNSLSINELSVLYLASAFGETFDDTLIEEVNFFPMLQGNSIKSCLERLSRSGLIECLGPQQYCRPYRFTQPIMKNIIYERMLYSQRRLIHKQYKEHFKINPIPSYIFYGLEPQVQSLVAENTLHFHFTQSSHYRNDKKNYDKLVIELIKANVIHDSHKVSSPTEPIFSCLFGKFSSDESKPPQARYLVVSSHYFSYYSTEDKYKQSQDLFILRVSHSDVAEVIFSVN